MATKRKSVDEQDEQAVASAKASEGKDAALPDSVADKTNIGERNTAGEVSQFNLMPDDERVSRPAPVAASEHDKSLPEPKGKLVPDAVQPDTELISVKGLVASGKMALAEVSVRHPGGQAVIIGDATAEVAPTFRVMTAIRDGVLGRA